MRCAWYKGIENPQWIKHTLLGIITDWKSAAVLCLHTVQNRPGNLILAIRQQKNISLGAGTDNCSGFCSAGAGTNNSSSSPSHLISHRQKSAVKLLNLLTWLRDARSIKQPKLIHTSGWHGPKSVHTGQERISSQECFCWGNRLFINNHTSVKSKKTSASRKEVLLL